MVKADCRLGKVKTSHARQTDWQELSRSAMEEILCLWNLIV